MGTLFSIGYVVGTIPTQVLLTKIRPSIFLPLVEILWGILVICMAAAKTVKTIYALRFLIGLLEAASYPGLIAVLVSWYVPSELGKRVAIFQSASALGAMWAGYLQAAVFAGLNGSHGLAGWKWGFIINGAITIPVGALGFFFLPDAPATTRARWLTSSDIAIAQERMKRVGRAPPGKLTRSKIVKCLTTWPLHAFLVPYAMVVVSGQAISFFSLWLKATNRYSTVKVNLIPTGGYAFEIFTAIVFAAISDFTGSRWSLIVVAEAFGLFGAIVLTVWDVPFGLHFVAHLFIFATVGGSALQLTWVSEICGGDAEARILIVSMMNTLAYVFNASLPFVMFPAKEAPHYKFGFQISVAFFSTVILSTIATHLYSKGRKSPFDKVEQDELDLDSASVQKTET
ncbi:major facilitator superfamily domain-containing protein [Mycena capillaripes]|nr:major facilitator superfamily domain-containing protein [Mycena capillaripes]